jgi:3-hydroxybutyrate dehydrogenase
VAMAKEGADVILNGLRGPAGTESQLADLEKRFGIRAVYHRADMTKPDQIENMIHQAVAAFGRIDILVNNAGIQHIAPVDEFPPEKWDSIIAVNLTASFHTIRTSLPYMKKQGWGRIIQIASAHALVAPPFKSAYVAAKHGLAGLTRTVALEVAQNKITCNAICPGYVWTPLVAGQIADTARARGMNESKVKSDVILAAQPTLEFTTVEQIGGLVVFLCTPSADNITGAMLSIDGGWTAA